MGWWGEPRNSGSLGQSPVFAMLGWEVSTTPSNPSGLFVCCVHRLGREDSYRIFSEAIIHDSLSASGGTVRGRWTSPPLLVSVLLTSGISQDRAVVTQGLKARQQDLEILDRCLRLRHGRTLVLRFRNGLLHL
jgi:hypothetical protein